MEEAAPPYPTFFLIKCSLQKSRWLARLYPYAECEQRPCVIQESKYAQKVDFFHFGSKIVAIFRINILGPAGTSIDIDLSWGVDRPLISTGRIDFFGGLLETR